MKYLIKKILRLFGFKLVPFRSIVMDARQIGNVLYYNDIYQRINSIEGNIVECGVGLGRSIFCFAYLAQKEGLNRRIFGFDSFEGFPEPSGQDRSRRSPKKGEWSGNSEVDIKDVLRLGGIHPEFIKNNILLVKGFVEDTLPQYTGGAIALLHIDLDLYSGYKVSLEHLVDHMPSGGIVLFDEYGTKQWPGATKAVDEFIKKRGLHLQKHPLSGKYFFVKN